MASYEARTFSIFAIPSCVLIKVVKCDAGFYQLPIFVIYFDEIKTIEAKNWIPHQIHLCKICTIFRGVFSEVFRRFSFMHFQCGCCEKNNHQCENQYF